MPETAQIFDSLTKVRSHQLCKIKALVVFSVLFSSHLIIHFFIKIYGDDVFFFTLIADLTISILVSITLYYMLVGKDNAVIKLNEQSTQLFLQKEELKKRALEISQKDLEMNQKFEEANKLNKLMVDRELKMVELKKELKKLKGDLI